MRLHKLYQLFAIILIVASFVMLLGNSDLKIDFAQAATITMGENTITSVADSGNANTILAQQSTLSQSATLQSLSFYVTTASGNLRLGVYDATGPGGGPGAKIAEAAEFAPVTGWNTVATTTQPFLNAGTYWLAYLPSSNGLAFRNAQTGSNKYYSFTYGALPATYSTTPSSGTFHFSFYASLDTGVADTTAPSTPTNLAATAISSSQINLSWTASTDNVGVTGYRVFRNGSQVGTPSGTSYSDTGLSASTTYTYTVAAVDAAGNVSGQSSSAQATTQAPPPPDSTAPTTPTNLAATAVSSSQINLTWTASTDNVAVTGYKIFRGGVQINTSATNSYSDTGLTASTSYSYTVSAYDAAGNNSSQSSSTSATTQAPSSGITVDAYVHLSSATIGAGLTTAILSAGTAGNAGTWALLSGAGGMTVGPDNFSRDKTITAGGTTYPTSFVSKSIAYNNAFNFTAVEPYTPTGHSSISTGGFITFGMPDVANGNLLDLVRIDNTQGHFVVFQLNNGTGGNSGQDYTVNIETDFNNQTTHSAYLIVTPGASYWWTLKADYVAGKGYLNLYNATTGALVGSIIANAQAGTNVEGIRYGNEELSVSAGHTTYFEDTLIDYTNANFPLGPIISGPVVADTTAPSVPTGLSATATSSSQINLSWTASTDNVGVTGYRVFRNGSQVGTPSGTSYSDAGLTASTTYSYTVAAVDAAGNASAQSSSGSATTQAITPPPPPPPPGASPIDASRSIDWSLAGIPGGIPNRTTICATLNPGATGAQISSALSACNNGVVFLNAGTYNIAGINFGGGKQNVTLRGAGSNQTFLTITSPGAGCLLTSGICMQSSDNNWKGAPSNTANWTAGYAKGTTSITLSNTTNLKVGSSLILDQQDDLADNGTIYVCEQSATISPTQNPPCNDDSNATGGDSGGQRGGDTPQVRGQSQIVKVTAINGTQVTFTPGLYMPNWRTSQNPGAWWATTEGHGLGVENLSIDHINSGANYGISMDGCNECWVSGVRSMNANIAHIIMETSPRAMIVNNYLYGTMNAATQSYGIEAFPSSDSLIQNNIVQKVTGPLKLNADCSGCVWAYNYTINDYYSPQLTWLNQSSGFHSVIDSVLVEGNVGSGIYMDLFHGTHNLNTAFRNRWNGDEPNNGTNTLNHTNPVLIWPFNRYNNFVGNVLGTSGYHTNYTALQGSTGTTQDKSIYVIGTGTDACCLSGDPKVASTLFRWGNYDTVSNAVKWDATEVPSGLTQYANPVPQTQTLPASLYLSAKPSWWPTAKAWPSIGPDVTGGNIAGVAGHAYTLPAQDCYNSMGGSADGTGTTALAFDSSVCYSSATPTFDFSMSNGGNKSVVQGSSVTNTATATLLSGSATALTFSASGLPTGATVVFTPTSCTPTCSSTLTITTTASTPVSTSTITITGTGGGLTRTTTFSLTVTGLANTLPVGTFDEIRISDGVVRAWTYDPDLSGNAIPIQIFFNGPAGTGTLVYSANTDILRSDVNTTFSVTGNHGVEFTIPTQYRDGANHSVYIYGIDGNDSTKSTLLTGSPKTFNLTAGTYPWSGIIDPTRAVDWSQAGVVGGIPSASWTQCGSTIAGGASATTIQTAINNCGANQFVKLGTGTFNLTTGLVMKSNMVLRGSGADQSILIFTGSNACAGADSVVCFLGGDSSDWSGDSSTAFGGSKAAAWTSGFAKGTNQIVLSSIGSNGIHVGQYIYLDQDNDIATNNGFFVCETTAASPPCSLEGGAGDPGRIVNGVAHQQFQVVKVTACAPSCTNGATFTISPSLYASNWSAAKHPGAWWSKASIENAGVEDLSINSTNAGGQMGVSMFNGFNLWVKGTRDIRSCQCSRSIIQMSQASHITIQDNYIFGTSGQSVNYGVETFAASDVLVVNNILQHVVAPMMLHANTGSVYLYNYAINSTYDDGRLPIYHWMGGIAAAHSGGVMYNLFEGNIGPAISGDYFHGNPVANTIFRNYLLGYDPGRTDNLIAVNLYSWNRYWNAVGNVLGTPAKTINYAAQNASAYGLGGGNAPLPDDPVVATTLLRWGNYDTVNNATRWLASEVPSSIGAYANAVPSAQILPASFYYSSKPSWWPSAKAWPPVGPDVTGGNISGLAGHVYTIPAEDCYLNVMGGPVDGGYSTGANTSPLNFNASNCYVAVASDTSAPSTPANLTATATSSSQINLTWTASTDNVGVTGYKIFRGGVQVGTSASTSYSDTGLTASTAYTYTVSAYDAASNNSSQSSSASATTSAVVALTGDINLDHIVNSVDYSILNSHWFTNYAPSDFNADGLINAIDWSLMNQNWLKTW